MKHAIIIPARLASTRFPRKVLADIHGEPLIWRVYEGCRGSSDTEDNIYVFTPDVEIAKVIRERGGRVVLTSPASTVLERCAYIKNLSSFDKYERIIVVQGDEPMVCSEMIDLCATKMATWSVSCLVKRLGPEDDPTNPNTVKLVMDASDQIVYFSRQPIPGITPERHEGIKRPPYYKQVCVMGFTRQMLARYNEMKLGPLERAEGIDQIRYIENGVKILGILSKHETQAVDTQEDLDKVRELLK